VIASAGNQAKKLAPAPQTAPSSLESGAAAAAALPENCSVVEEGAGISGPMARLPVELDVTVPVRGFRVRSLLALNNGQLIESQWGSGDDMPLMAGDVQLAWSEFEVVDSRLAVRITRLA
jgi:flagellar motor switch protein FliN/FliY